MSEVDAVREQRAGPRQKELEMEKQWCHGPANRQNI